MITIPLSRGQFALIDEDDADLILGLRWYAFPTRGGKFYARSTKKHAVFMHNLLMAPPAGLVVDHKNRDGLDNRRSNLRFATASQNAANAVQQTAQPYTGVERLRTSWRAVVTLNGVKRHIGGFPSAEEAAAARDALALELHGEFAALNSIVGVRT